jgi:hypothetical protein
MLPDNTSRAKRSAVGIAFTGVLAVGFLIFGTLCAYDAVLWAYRQEAAWYWPGAPGQILALHSHSRGGPSVEYSYTVNGRVYRTSADIPLLGRRRFSVGSHVPVHFNPQKPQISVLGPGFSWLRLWQFSYGIFFLMWSFIMAMLTVDSYRHPENTRWSFGWKKIRRRASAESPK